MGLFQKRSSEFGRSRDPVRRKRRWKINCVQKHRSEGKFYFKIFHKPIRLFRQIKTTQIHLQNFNYKNFLLQGLSPPVLVFVQSKERAQALFNELLYDGIMVDVIHADRTQTQVCTNFFPLKICEIFNSLKFKTF